MSANLPSSSFLSTALADADGYNAGFIIFGRAEAENAGDRCDNDAVVSCGKAGGGGKAKPVKVGIFRGVFFYVDVPLRNVRFRLVVVVIADEILDGVFREKLFEFLV